MDKEYYDAQVEALGGGVNSVDSVFDEDPTTDVIHEIWWKFSKHFQKWYYVMCTSWKYDEEKREVVETGKQHKEFSSHEMIGYKTMKRVEKYCKKNPAVKHVCVDDSHFAGSMVVLVPHPEMGISVIYIPQCSTKESNQFFLYIYHIDELVNTITAMKDEYKIKDRL